MAKIEDMVKQNSRYNQGVGVSAASGSVLALMVSIITMLIDKLSEVSSSNPVLIIALSVITGIAVLALIVGVVMVMLNRGADRQLSEHIGGVKSFLNENCDVDSNGQAYLKSGDGAARTISNQHIADMVRAVKPSVSNAQESTVGNADTNNDGNSAS